MSDYNFSPKVAIERTFNANMGIVNATTNKYTDLAYKPEINGVTLLGNKTSAELGIVEDKTFVYTQAVPSTVWEIEHNLNKYPAIVIVDSGDSMVAGEVVYIDENNVRVTFNSAFSGKAYLN